jgi:hypothetical protein
MAVKSGQINVGTTPTIIPATSNQPYRLQIKNLDNTDALFLGNGDVSVSSGMRLDKEERIELTLGPLDRVHLISAKATHAVAYVIIANGPN